MEFFLQTNDRLQVPANLEFLNPNLLQAGQVGHPAPPPEQQWVLRRLPFGNQAEVVVVIGQGDQLFSHLTSNQVEALGYPALPNQRYRMTAFPNGLRLRLDQGGLDQEFNQVIEQQFFRRQQVHQDVRNLQEQERLRQQEQRDQYLAALIQAEWADEDEEEDSDDEEEDSEDEEEDVQALPFAPLDAIRIPEQLELPFAPLDAIRVPGELELPVYDSDSDNDSDRGEELQPAWR